MRRLARIFIVFVCLTPMCLLSGAWAAVEAGRFEALQKRLIGDGFEEKGVKRLYARPELAFDGKGVSLYFVHSEGRLDYGQFTRKSRLRKARKYMRTYRTELARAQKKYDVPPEVIAAILLVETNLGGYVGKRLVINTLSTMAALADTAVRDVFWDEIAARTHLSKSEYEEKAGKKSEWAYGELKAFFIYTYREKLNPMTLTGSYAGAMGIPQFIPTSIIRLAMDGDYDGRIDLMNHADAVMSVANYLHHYGWRPGLDHEKAYQVVYHYNHSSYYVNTVLKIADLIGSKRTEQTKKPKFRKPPEIGKARK